MLRPKRKPSGFQQIQIIKVISGTHERGKDRDNEKYQPQMRMF
jgi:hypothetical protein